MNGRHGSRTLGGALSASVIALLAIAPGEARADVRHEGTWDDDPKVTLDLAHTPRAEAVKKLAQAAGWSVVLDNVPMGEPIDLHIDAQPAGKVIDLLLTDGHYVARRDHALLVIRRADAAEVAPAEPSKAPPVDPRSPAPAGTDGAHEAAPPALPRPPAPPRSPGSEPEGDDGPEGRGPDREIIGASLRIEKGEVVDDVNVVGGNVDVFGTVTGDLMVTGGNVRVHEGGRVMGSATTMGGSITLDDRARIDGDVDTIGGSLRRGKGSEIHGDVKVDERPHDQLEGSARPFFRRLAEDAGSAITRAALLFVFGAVLLSLATDRVDQLKAEIAGRPMRSFTTGILAVLASIVVVVALCVTVVGIPFALIGILGGFVAVCAGVCAVLETGGRALLGHRTRNPYVHLAFGCGLFLILGAIPFFGGIVKAIVFLIGFGAVAATRGAGLFPQKNRPNGSPYREPQAV